MPHTIVAEELRLLAWVAAALARLPAPENASEDALVAELRRLTGVLVAGEDGKDAAALRDQWHRTSSVLRQLRDGRPDAVVEAGSPYFAHLRLCENGDERDLCIGRATCIDGGLRIVDWRDAPISKIFYGYRQGDEYEEKIAGRLREGHVVARRLVSIRDGGLERVQAPEGDFVVDPASEEGWRALERERSRLAGGEGSATRARVPESSPGSGRFRAGLDPRAESERGDKHLREITGLIDPEQFDLISRPRAGFLVIRGTAGSGKTTVALHRVAYLAYDDPDIDSNRSLVVVFSPALRNYVSHVLPGLGLNHVRISTFQDWAASERRRHFPAFPHHSRDDTPAVVQRLKLHPALGVALERQVERVSGQRSREQAIDDWSSVLTQAEWLEDVLGAEAPGIFSAAAIEEFTSWNRRLLEDLNGFLAREPESRAALDPEDDALLLRAWQLRVGTLRGGRGRPLRFRHIAVDEVQDFSPIEVRVLLDCLQRDASITLAGDTQQHVFEGTGFTSWSEFLDRLGVPGTAVDTLRISYRSSQEIVDFAGEVLGDLREDEPAVAIKHGPPVELFRFSERGACVAFLAEALQELVRVEPTASVAILTPSRAASEEYFRALLRSEVPGIRCVRNQDFSFASGIEVSEIEQAKGLEFDYVILVDVNAANYADTPMDRRRLHVGATRAVHQLWMTTLGTPSPLIPRRGDDASTA